MNNIYQVCGSCQFTFRGMPWDQLCPDCAQAENAEWLEHSDKIKALEAENAKLREAAVEMRAWLERMKVSGLQDMSEWASYDRALRLHEALFDPILNPEPKETK